MAEPVSPFTNDQELRVAALDRAIHWLLATQREEKGPSTPAAVITLAGKFEGYLRG